MKVRVNKQWWQFWLPPSIDIESALNYRGLPVVLDKDAPTATMFVTNEQPLGMDGVAAIESDGQEPSWHNEPDEESSVITAEPPIVYASRGNAKVAQREKS